MLHGEIHGGSGTEEPRKCGMLCQVKLGRPGHVGEGAVQEKSIPLGAGTAVLLLMECLGWAWRGPGDNSQGWSCSRKLLVLDNPTLPEGEAFQGRFHQSPSLELLPALIQSRWTLSLGAGGGGQWQSPGTLCCAWERDSEGGTTAPPGLLLPLLPRALPGSPRGCSQKVWPCRNTTGRVFARPSSAPPQSLPRLPGGANPLFLVPAAALAPVGSESL